MSTNTPQKWEKLDLRSDYMEGLTTVELLTFEMLLNDDIHMLMVLVKRKIRARGIRRGVAA